MLICRPSSRAAVGHRCGNGSQQPPTPQCSGQWCAHLQHVSGMLVGLLGSSPPSCQAASWEHRGSKGVPLRSPLRLPPGEGGHMLAAGKVRNVFFFFFSFYSQDFIPHRSSRRGKRHLCTSSSEALCLRAAFTTVLQKGQPLSGLG